MTTQTTNTWTPTDEHRAQIPAWNARWQALALTTEPINMEKLAPAIVKLYAAAPNLKEPRVVYIPCALNHGIIVNSWAGVFWDAKEGGKTVKNSKAVANSIITRALAACITPTVDNSRAVADAAVTAALPIPATDPPIIEGWNEARDYILSFFNKSEHAALNEMAKKSLDHWTEYHNGGNEWCPWVSYMSFVRDIVGWKDESHANYAHYEDACIYGGVRYMHSEFCLVADRPVERNVEKVQDRYVLHNESGPAIKWRGGRTIWSIHGVGLGADGEQIVMRPETQTIAQIDGETNEEIRRIRIERFGWTRYLDETNAKVIDKRRNDVDTQRETLYKLENGRQRFRVRDPSTGREYALGVPQEVKTAEEAQNYLSQGLSKRTIGRS